MRHLKSFSVLALVAAVAVSACQTQPTPTAVPVPPPTLPIGTPDPALPTQDTSGVPVPTRQEVGLVSTLFGSTPVTMSAPGSVRFPEATEPVNPDQPVRQFQSLRYSRIQGFDGPELVIEMNIDGTLTRDGVVGALPQSEVQAVINAIQALRLTEAITSFTGPEQTNEAYRYTLRLFFNDGTDRFLPAMEAYTAPEYLRFLNALAQLGLQPFPAF